MRRLRNISVALAIAVGSFGVGATVAQVNATAPVAYDEYNGAVKQRDWNVLPGTDCLTAGAQRRQVPDGQPISQCTPVATTTTQPVTTTTSTTVPVTSTSTTTTTTTTTTAPATTTTTVTPTTTTTVPGGAQFVETFDNGTGLDRFNYGVYHRGLAAQEFGQPLPNDMNNNSYVAGTWTGDHDLNCGSPATQRQLRSDFQQDTTGANGWHPIVNFHLPEIVYTCGPPGTVGNNGHLMTSMGDIGAYTVIWFSPKTIFPTVDSVTFEVNLTNLNDRKWWKVGIVSDSLYRSTYRTPNGDNVLVPGHLVSDVGSANLNGLDGSDRLFATWSGGASGGYPGCIKIGSPQTGVCVNPAPNDKMTRFPVTLTDNHNGTVTFTVAGTSITRSGSFPACPCHVVFQDHNYTPDKDGVPQGHTWHWDAIVVR